LTADVVVLGAGPAGLAAAWLVARAGHEVTVIERAGAVGGMAASFDVAGQRVDHGSHRLHPATDPVILATLDDLLAGALQRRPRHGRLRLAGRWLGFPLAAGDLVRHLPPRLAAGIAADAVLRPTRRIGRGASFAEIVTAGLGPTVATNFYLPYATKLFGLPPDELDGELARRRVSGRSVTAIARRLAAPRSAAGRTFHYPRRGFGQIPEALADAATAARATVRLCSRVCAVEPRPDGVTVTLDDGETITAGRLWSTIPTGALAALASAPDAELAAAGALTYRAMVLVYLALDQPRYTEFDAHYLPSTAHPVSRLSEPKNYRDGPDPAGRTVLCAEVPCAVDGATWTASDDELGAMVVDALGREGLPAVRPIEVAVRRLPHVYPVYRRGWAAHQDALEAWAAGHERLLVLGRQALFAHDNTHHALAMAWAAADCLDTDGGFDHPRWRAARNGFRSHVVVD
jgi:protoporphyrinogen oxidase